MKHISKKMWRSVAAIAMVCCMLFSMATSVFAAETETNTIKLADIKAVIAEIAAEIEANGLEATAQNAYDYAEANGIIDEAAVIAEALKVSVEENGVEATVKGVYDYAEANGIIDQIESLLVELEAEWEIVKNSPEFQAAVAEFEAKLIETVDEINALADALVAELESQKALLEAELAALKAEVEAAVEEVKAEIEAVIAEVKAAIAEVEAMIAEVKAAVEEFNAAVEATIAAIEAAVNEVIDTVNAVIAEIEATIAKVKATIAEIEAVLTEINANAEEIIAVATMVIEMMYETATNGFAFIDEYTTVLSLGDSLAVSDDTDAFGKKLADELAAMVGSDLEYAELAIDGMRVEDLRAILDETYAGDAYTADLIDDIAAARDEAYQAIMTAGVITLSLGHDNFTAFAMDQVMGYVNGAAYEMDWARYVTADGVAYVEAALAEVAAALVEQGIPADTAELVTFAVEAYAYGYAGFLFNYDAVVAKIAEINPFATLILVGNYNAMDGMTINVEGAEIPVGEIVDCFIELVDLQTLAAAMTNFATFVDIAETETVFDADVAAGEYEKVTFELFMANVALTGGGVMSASENGQEYIKDQILNAVTFEVYEEPPVEELYDFGDVNMDGIVNIQDAVQAYYYVNGKLDLSEESLRLADVSAPFDNVNIQDAVLLYYFVNGKAELVFG